MVFLDGPRISLGTREKTEIRSQPIGRGGDSGARQRWSTNGG